MLIFITKKGRSRGVEEWKNEMLERFYHGGTEITELEEWKSGKMEEFDNGKWKNG